MFNRRGGGGGGDFFTYVFKLMSAVRIISVLQQLKGRDPGWKKFNVRYCHVTQWVLIVGSKYI